MDQVEILKTKVVVWVEELDAALVSRKIQVLGVVKDRTGLKHAHAAILSAGVFFLILLSVGARRLRLFGRGSLTVVGTLGYWREGLNKLCWVHLSDHHVIPSRQIEGY